MQPPAKFEFEDEPQRSRIAEKTGGPLPTSPSKEDAAAAELARQAADSFARSHEEWDNLGEKLSASLEASNYHPVIIFGTTHSGKSSFVASLLGFLQTETILGIGIRLGPPILNDGSEYAAYVHKAASAFFHRSLQEFMGGTAHAQTRERFPFFIPVIVTPKTGPEVSFAFMESNGEHYKVNREAAEFFPKLREEVDGILRDFSGGASFIYVAPYTQLAIRVPSVDSNDSTSKFELNEADLALKGALTSYIHTRAFKNNDSHMFLVTKWDARTSADEDLDDVIREIDKDEVLSFTRSTYVQSFAAFHALGSGEKRIMHYCSGLISGRRIANSAKLKPLLDQYPAKMWNLLYADAVRAVTKAAPASPLIPIQATPKKTIFDYIRSAVDRLLS